MDESSQVPTRKRQVVLRGAQLQTAIGAELCQILASLSDDGRVDVKEVERLAAWLAENQSSEIPAIAHLSPIIKRILIDGIVTPEEAAVLQVEVERVLPADLRAGAKLSRKQAMAEEKQRIQQEIEAALQAKNEARRLELEERRRNGPVMCLDFVVAGVNYEGRGEYIESRLKNLATLPLQLAVQPENPYDVRAVAVLLDGRVIGYIPRGDAAEVQPLLMSGHGYAIRVKTTICGRQHTIPVIDGEIYAPGNARGITAKPESYEGSAANEKGGGATQFGAFIILAIMALCIAVYILSQW